MHFFYTETLEEINWFAVFFSWIVKHVKKCCIVVVLMREIIAIRHSTDNTKVPIIHTFLSLNHALETRFITDDFANFCSKNFFITILPFLLLHRGVQKWSIAKYCPHFSFITLVLLYEQTIVLKKPWEEIIIYGLLLP